MTIETGEILLADQYALELKAGIASVFGPSIEKQAEVILSSTANRGDGKGEIRVVVSLKTIEDTVNFEELLGKIGRFFPIVGKETPYGFIVVLSVAMNGSIVFSCNFTGIKKVRPVGRG